MTIVPLAGPRSTSSARMTRSLYQPLKSSDCGTTAFSSRLFATAQGYRVRSATIGGFHRVQREPLPARGTRAGAQRLRRLRGGGVPTAAAHRVPADPQLGLRRGPAADRVGQVVV